MADISRVRNVFQEALDIMGGDIHILINCGGIQKRESALEFKEESWDEVSWGREFRQIDDYVG